MTRRRIILIAALAALGVGAAAQAALATITATQSAAGQQPTYVSIVRGAGSTAASTSSWVDLPGASTTVTVPSGHKAMLLARFSGESACIGTGVETCSIRVLIGGVEAAPAAGTADTFDSNDSGQEGGASWQADSIERWRSPLAAGSYTVKVQYRTNDADGTFYLDDWTLVAERIKVS
jgi:glucose/arabinose dehydrogenase